MMHRIFIALLILPFWLLVPPVALLVAVGEAGVAMWVSLKDTAAAIKYLCADWWIAVTTKDDPDAEEWWGCS